MQQDPRQVILDTLTREIAERPPTIGVVGVSGTGKSSTINSLFKTALPTSATVARTKEFEDVDLSVKFNVPQPPARPAAPQDVQPAEASSAADPDTAPKVRLRVVDAPGLGEDLSLDSRYLDLYKTNLGRCDAVLWVMTARNRAVALDQMYLEQLSAFHEKIVFGLNQVDLVEPMGWRTDYNIPSREQESNIKIIVADRLRHLSSIMGREPNAVAYSSRTGYHLEHLFKAMLDACPSDRRWIYAGLKNFSHLDFIPAETQDRPVFRATRRLAQIMSRFNA
jgi:predicted GTPase